jgi:hypothetical protein
VTSAFFFGPRMWSRSGSTGTARSVIVFDVPSSARSLRLGDSRLTPVKISQDSAVEPIAAVSMPSLASARSVPVKASEAITSDTANPIPAAAPAPATAPQPTVGVTRPRLTLLTSHAAPAVPTGLPTR